MKYMISIVVPVFNEVESLEEFNQRLLSTCNILKENFEIIYSENDIKVLHNQINKELKAIRCKIHDFFILYIE